MWKRKNHMKVRRIDHLSPAFIHPDLFEDCLSIRTIAVAAGIIMDHHMPAVAALAEIITKLSGFAVHDGKSGFLLNVRMSRVSIVRILKYLSDFELIHGRHLPYGRKG